MYKISKQNGELLGITESPTYIKLHPNGSFTLAGEADAIGVAYHSVPYNLIGHDDIEGADTVVVAEMDSGAMTAALGVLLGSMSSVDADALASQLRRAVQFFAETLGDADALSVAGVYPTFDELVECKYTARDEGYKFRHGDMLYKTAQPNVEFVAHYPPGAGTESMYTRIDETHAGTLGDPIPYDGNMALESGKYYAQDGAVYLCIRDTGIPVYAALRDLVGLYVEEVSGA